MRGTSVIIMAKNQKDLADSLLADESGGWLTGFLADENEFDRRTLWRLGSWGVGSVGAMIIAILANQSGAGHRHEQMAAADLARQTQQLQSIAKTGERENQRLASAIDTLNGDRDRLFARVTVLEQGLDSVTGSINRKSAAQNEPSKTALPKAALSSPQAPPALSPPDKVPPSQAGSAQSAASAPPPPAPVTATASALPAIPPDTPPGKTGKAESPERAPLSPVVASVTSTAPATVAEPAASTTPDAAKAPAAKPASAKSAPEVSPSVKTPPASPVAAASPPAADPPAPASAKPQIASTPAEPPTAKPDDPEVAAKAAPTPSELPKNKDAQIVVASLPAAVEAEPATPAPIDVPVAHTDFGVDLGSASSIKGLRALWRGVLKSDAKEVASLRPIIVLKERANGLGMQLRLVAGPLVDAAAAARICAVLSENKRTCETAVFDGQRLAMRDAPGESVTAAPAKKPRPPHASARHRHNPKTARVEDPAPPPPPPPQPSTFRSFFSR